MNYYGHYQYNDAVVRGWDSATIGVYYCGYLNPQNPSILLVSYVGKAVSEGGIRGRLLEHVRDDYWPEVTHFGYQICSSAQEAELIEAAEIRRLQPPRNTQLK